MNIGQVALACGLPSKTIRYYEEIGLVLPKRHPGNDYRIYSMDDVARLRFLQRARVVGFSLDECRELLALYSDPQSRSAQTKVLVREKISQIDQQLIALHAMRDTLVSISNEYIGINTDVGNKSAGSARAALKKPAPMAFTLVDEPANLSVDR